MSLKQIESNNDKRIWYIPDCEMPPAGNEDIIGHESVIILNPCTEDAHIRITLYFADADPIRDIDVTVGAERVRCLRTYNKDDFGGHTIPLEVQYAMKLESDMPVVVQYGRLDVRQPNMAFYTTLGCNM